jgi:hypothetical protein
MRNPKKRKGTVEFEVNSISKTDNNIEAVIISKEPINP